VRTVLIVTHSFVARDARIRRQIEAFRDSGWKVRVLSLDPNRDDGDLRIRRVPMQRRRGNALRYLWEYGLFFAVTLAWVTRQAFFRAKPDLIYINSLPDFLVFAAIPGRMRRIPIILDVHDPMPELFTAKERSSPLLWRALAAQERASVAFADSTITVHEPLRDLLATRSPEVDFDIVMNVPDLSSWGTTDWDSHSRVIVYNGSIAVRYGLEELMRAVAEVRSDIPDISVRLIGEGEDLPRLLKLAAQLGIADRIEDRGRVAWRDLPQHLADAWVGYNVPRPDELGVISFSNKVVEWVSFGLPVIAGATPIMQQHFPDGTLWYATLGDVGDVAQVLRKLDAASPDEVQKSIAASRQALSGFDWPVQRERLLDVAERLTAARG
jgi:glycosyltransferase involved in cell wall biosynthesis